MICPWHYTARLQQTKTEMYFLLSASFIYGMYFCTNILFLEEVIKWNVISKVSVRVSPNLLCTLFKRKNSSLFCLGWFSKLSGLHLGMGVYWFLIPNWLKSLGRAGMMTAVRDVPVIIIFEWLFLYVPLGCLDSYWSEIIFLEYLLNINTTNQIDF